MRVKRIAMKIVFYIYIMIILIFTGPIWAEDSVPKPPVFNEQRSPADTEPVDEPATKLDYLQVKASSLLADGAHWLDSHFEDGISLPEKNKSRGTLKFAFGYSRHDHLELKPRLSLRLRLPRLSRRANLLLDGSDNSDFNVDQNPISSRRSNDDNDKGQWRLALRYFLEDRDQFKVSLSGGLSWGYLYGGVKLRATHDINKWMGRFSNRLRYYTDDGWENRASYELERELSEKYYFRSTTGIDILEHEEGIPHYQRFSLFQVLGPISTMTYETGIYFDSEPSHEVTDIQFVAKYRQRFFRDWLVLEVSPRISFPAEYNRKVNPGIVFTFMATFGYDSNNEGHNKIFSR